MNLRKIDWGIQTLLLAFAGYFGLTIIAGSNDFGMLLLMEFMVGVYQVMAILISRKWRYKQWHGHLIAVVLFLLTYFGSIQTGLIYSIDSDSGLMVTSSAWILAIWHYVLVCLGAFKKVSGSRFLTHISF